MKNVIGAVIGFLIGAATGYILADKRLKIHYEQKTREAVESVKKAYKNVMDESFPGEFSGEILTNEESSPEPDGNGESQNHINGKEEVVMAHKEPYEISPQEFGSRKGYISERLIYCADGVIADEDGEIIENEEELLGVDIHELVANADGESVYIRNDAEQLDYEIAPDEREYEYIQFAEPFDPEDL